MGHSYACLHVHAVFSTKGRAALIDSAARPRLVEYVGGICRAERCSLVAANTMPDHARLLVRLHPSVLVSGLMQEVKRRSSAFVREAFPGTRWDGWQNGYAGFAVSRSGLEAVESYIAGQEAHHRRMTFQEEFVALLERHGVEYDPRYLWD